MSASAQSRRSNSSQISPPVPRMASNNVYTSSPTLIHLRARPRVLSTRIPLPHKERCTPLWERSEGLSYLVGVSPSGKQERQKHPCLETVE